MNAETLRLLLSVASSPPPKAKAKGVSAVTGEQMVPVKSDWAAFVLYHAKTRELEVECHKGEFIVYPDVSQEEFEALLQAESVYRYCCALGDSGNRGYKVIKG